MPFNAGALSVRRFAVLGEIPRTFEQTATLAMRRYAWRAIDSSRGERESFGWVNPRSVLDDSFTFEDVYTRPYLYLGVRRDRKAFSPVLFRARRERRFEDVKSERKLQKLTRQHRLAVEEELTVEMLKETSPQSSFAELVWDQNSNTVLMGATSNTLCERIQEIFEATFDLKMRPTFPALTGAQFIASQGLEHEYQITTAQTTAGAK